MSRSRIVGRAASIAASALIAVGAQIVGSGPASAGSGACGTPGICLFVSTSYDGNNFRTVTQAPDLTQFPRPECIYHTWNDCAHSVSSGSQSSYKLWTNKCYIGNPGYYEFIDAYGYDPSLSFAGQTSALMVSNQAC